MARHRDFEDTRYANLHATVYRFFKVAMSEVVQESETHEENLEILFDFIQNKKHLAFLHVFAYKTINDICVRDFFTCLIYFSPLNCPKPFLFTI
jgi:hypothetical protein